MKLRKCPRCKELVGAESEICPRCGAAFREVILRRVAFWTIVAALLIWLAIHYLVKFQWH